MLRFLYADVDALGLECAFDELADLVEAGAEDSYTDLLDADPQGVAARLRARLKETC